MMGVDTKLLPIGVVPRLQCGSVLLMSLPYPDRACLWLSKVLVSSLRLSRPTKFDWSRDFPCLRGYVSKGAHFGPRMLSMRRLSRSPRELPNEALVLDPVVCIVLVMWTAVPLFCRSGVFVADRPSGPECRQTCVQQLFFFCAYMIWAMLLLVNPMVARIDRFREGNLSGSPLYFSMPRNSVL